MGLHLIFKKILMTQTFPLPLAHFCIQCTYVHLSYTGVYTLHSVLHVHMPYTGVYTLNIIYLATQENIQYTACTHVMQKSIHSLLYVHVSYTRVYVHSVLPVSVIQRKFTMYKLNIHLAYTAVIHSIL
jgi:hypothetical protein